jgi:hypothetical protein
MSTFNKLYERTIARLLSDHTAKAIPPDTDLWPSIQERLTAQENAVERASESEQAGIRVRTPLPPMRPQISTGGTAIRLWRSAGALAGFATFALFALITTLTISGLANRTAKNNLQPSPIVAGREEYTILFSLTFTPPTMLQSITGFDISEDGTFWVVGQEKHLLHYSPDGTLLDTRELSASRLIDLEVYDGSIWTLDDSREVFKIRLDSGLTDIFKPYYPVPGTTVLMPGPYDAYLTLRPGGDGQMLIDEGSRYRIVTDQISGKSGQLEPQPLPGYPANGKYYRIDEERKDLILAGDVPVTVSISDTLSSLHVFKVMADGSFYVAAVVTAKNNCCQQAPSRAYIMHYSADGTLIEHARTPDLGQRLAATKQLAVSEDGTFYAAQAEIDHTNAPTNRVNILRLNFIPASEPLPPLPTPTSSIANTVDDTTLLFFIPVGEGGIHYITSTHTSGSSPRLGFTATAPDGTFWAADGTEHLAHYDTTGTRLGSIPLPYDEADPFSMEIEQQDNTFWLYYRNSSQTTDLATIYHLAPDGHQIASYSVPDYVQSRTNGRLSDFLLGERGEVLLRGHFDDLIPGSPYFPKPVPTQVMTPTPPKLYWQLVDAQGNLTSTPLESYTFGGHTYTVRPAYSNARVNRGYIKVDNIEVELITTHALTDFDLLHVNEDGSFFAGALEDEQVGDPYILTHYTIYHYSVDGRLLERAIQPMQGVRLPTGHFGYFYTIFEQPYWEQRDGKAPEKIEVRRLTFYPADQPLPTLPTAIPSVPAQSTVPSPTLIPPPVPSTVPPGGATEDLRALKAESDVVAQVKITGYNRVSTGHILTLQVERWLWQSTFTDTEIIHLLVPDDQWNLMPERFKANVDPNTQDTRGENVYILFLNAISPLTDGDNTWGDLYSLVDGPTGAFKVGKFNIEDAGIPKYNGWPLDAFRDAITNMILATPTVPISQSFLDLSSLEQSSELIVEVEWPKKPAREMLIAGERRLFQNVKITEQLKNSWDGEYIGLSLTQAEYDLLSKGSGNFILFLISARTQDTCFAFVLNGYFQLQQGTKGVVEIVGRAPGTANGRIGYSGIEAYANQDVPVQEFKMDLQLLLPTLIPTPIASPTPAPTYAPTFPDLANSSQVIVQVELAGEDISAHPESWHTYSVKVQKWLKNPQGYLPDTILVNIDNNHHACGLSLGNGPYIFFLHADKDPSPDAPYAMTGFFPTFGVVNDTIEFSPYPKYWGQPVSKLEQDIRTLAP